MNERLLLCTDLDRTLIPNGHQPESPGGRELFAQLVSRPEVTLTYVTGRHRELVEQAIRKYALPSPDFVIANVGTTIYRIGEGNEWVGQPEWEAEIATDWQNKTASEIATLFIDLQSFKLQEQEKQGRYKLSYYVPVEEDTQAQRAEVSRRLESIAVSARQVWSIDEQKQIGLLDILPARASKYHAIEALMSQQGFDIGNTIFCGDSGNDLEVLSSPIASVLVANALPDVQKTALRMASRNGYADQLYIAQGGWKGMNGNYSSGMLEGIVHYHPGIISWLNAA